MTAPTTGADRPARGPLAAVILAAGEGTRMRSKRAKVLHEVAGRPLVEHVVRAALQCGASPVVVVVGVQADAVRDHLVAACPGAPLVFAEQTERRGTADAVGRARPALAGFGGDVLILCGDVPALGASALSELLRQHREADAALTVLSAVVDDASGYGRIVRGPDGALREIVEQRDATAEIRAIREFNTGTYAARWPVLEQAIDAIRPDNAQNEYYLTDAVKLILARGARAIAAIHPVAEEALGVNSRRQLAQLGALMNRALLDRLMDQGVTVIDPASTWVQDTVTIAPDTVLHPGVTLEGRTTVEGGAVVRTGCRLTDVHVGAEATVLDYTVASSSVIGAGASVGPFAHLRPGTVLGEHCKVGNFVETKKTTMGDGSKASHLSYLGDATIGEGVNIGAGTITCNYDGEKKHPTVLEDGVFIGSDTQLVAPVKVGKGAYVGAGTTVTKDVPAGALTLTRPEQKIIEGWVARRVRKH